MMNALFKTAGQDALSIANTLGTNASGNTLSRRRVGFHVRSCLERFTKLATNTRAHKVVSAGRVLRETFLVDNAEDEGMLFCAEGESASDASPNVGSSVRCLLPPDVLRFDMEPLFVFVEFQIHHFEVFSHASRSKNWLF